MRGLLAIALGIFAFSSRPSMALAIALLFGAYALVDGIIVDRRFAADVAREAPLGVAARHRDHRRDLRHRGAGLAGDLAARARLPDGRLGAHHRRSSRSRRPGAALGRERSALDRRRPALDRFRLVGPLRARLGVWPSSASSRSTRFWRDLVDRARVPAARASHTLDDRHDVIRARGRRSRRSASAIATIAGINIGGTTTTVVGGLDDGTMVARWSRPTPVADGELLIESVLDAVKTVAPNAQRIGIAVGGPLNVRAGVVTEAVALAGTARVPLRDRIATALESTGGAAPRCRGLRAWPNGAGARTPAPTSPTLPAEPDSASASSAGQACATPPTAARPRSATSAIATRDRRSSASPAVTRASARPTRSALLAALARAGSLPDGDTAQVVDEVRKGNADARWALRQNEVAVGAACAMLADLLALDAIVLGTLAAYLGRRLDRRRERDLRDRSARGERRVAARCGRRCRTFRIAARWPPPSTPTSGIGAGSARKSDEPARCAIGGLDIE